ncbi:MAG TPA: MgtC/SapB family protein, partial [Byssovorax sp.]
LLRIACGAALGAVIGYERDRHGRQAGLRTHLIVAMTSATFMVVSAKFVYLQHYAKDDLVAVDPSRIAASVVAGIGFLAGGSILRTGLTIQGLTTAAALWLVTAIGMCSGAGMYVEAVVVTAMGIFALTALRRLEDKDDKTTRRRIALTFGDDVKTAAEALAALEALGAVVGDVDYDLRIDHALLRVTIDARVPRGLTIASLVETLEGQRGVRRVHVVGGSAA